MLSAIRFNLGQSKILSSGNGLNKNFDKTILNILVFFSFANIVYRDVFCRVYQVMDCSVKGYNCYVMNIWIQDSLLTLHHTTLYFNNPVNPFPNDKFQTLPI